MHLVDLEFSETLELGNRVYGGLSEGTYEESGVSSVELSALISVDFDYDKLMYEGLICYLYDVSTVSTPC